MYTVFCLLIHCFSPTDLPPGNWFSLRRVLVDHKPVNHTDKDSVLRINSSGKDLMLEFRVPDSDGVEYRYQLSGYEMDWVTTAYPVARYTRLPAGDYVFTIRAVNDPADTGRYSLKVLVDKSVSESWWFIPLMLFWGLVLMAGSFYLFFLNNFRQKMKVQNLRNRISADLHDEIGSTLSSIAISARVVTQKLHGVPPEVNLLLSQMESDSKDIIYSIRDTVWALNPANDSFEALIEKIRSFALQILSAQGIEAEFDNTVSLNKIPELSPDQRKSFFLIAKEAIHNIVKHSGATRAVIKTRRTDTCILMEISDNGKGFDTGGIMEGNGLKNMRKRASEGLFGLDILSSPDGGTYLRVEIPIL